VGEPIAAPASEGSWLRRRRLLVAVVVVVAIVVAVGIWADKKADGYFAYLPGSAPTITTSAQCRLGGSGTLVLPGGEPCARLVIEDGHAHVIEGRLLMVDVLEGTATPFEYLEQRLGLLNWFHKGAQLLSNASVLGTTPAAQYNCQDDQDMATASQTAPVLALTRLGYHVKYQALGARVEEVLSGTGASSAGIKCNDLITAVNGKNVTTAADVGSILHTDKPGNTVKVTVERTGSNGKTQKVTLATRLSGFPAKYSPTGKAEPNVPFLGIETYTQGMYTLPFRVSVEVGDIGGPSAGLALTLGLLDALSDGTLTGGHVIAATGTIDSTGAVGAIGGVQQKTVAVERAGAKLFLVPPDNYQAAENEADSGLKVEAVSTLSQALEDIRNFGGHIPTTTTGRSVAS
jgi:PDZ domain-containing protein